MNVYEKQFLNKMAVAMNNRNVIIASIALLLDEEEQLGMKKILLHDPFGQDHGFSAEKVMEPSILYSRN